MSAHVEFLLRLLEQDEPVRVSHEDFEGEHGDFLRMCQAIGFVGCEPGFNPVPSCPHCDNGVPYWVRSRFVCNCCRSEVAQQHLRCWRLDIGAFLGWLASRLRLRGGIRRIDRFLWQLGTWAGKNGLHECFFRRGGLLSALGESRLAAYRNAIVFWGLIRPSGMEWPSSRDVSLVEVLEESSSLVVGDLNRVVNGSGTVRFDEHSGALWAGGVRLGEVPPGCKEYHFLRCLARNLDKFVPYTDLKRFILRHSGSTDTTEEAGFCHGLKRRIKKYWIPQIDLLLATTNKADGYRLRGSVEMLSERSLDGRCDASIAR